MPKRDASVVIEEMEHAGERHLVIGFRLPRPAFLMDLTPTELQVMDAWVAGASMRAIAEARGVAERTVANQLASIYRKCGVGSRDELQARLQHER